MLLSNFSFGQLIETPKASQPFISATPSIYNTERDDTPNPASRSAICTDPTLVKYVNVNIHFIQDDKGRNNFTAESDGQGNYNYTGYDRANDLINNMNAQFTTNAQMNLPCNNTTAVLPIRIQYVLKGVYFHRSSDYSNDGVGNWNVHWNLRKNPNTEINIYHIHYPNIPYAGGTADGVAITVTGSTNLAVKIWKDYKAYLTTGGAWITTWETAKLLNHEVAHNLGLRHAWGEWGIDDGCTDTPFNNNCWYTNPTSPCSTWCSNNLMDYNADQSAVTPCQIGIMHDKLNTGANPYIHSCDGCMPSNSFFYLPETVCLEGELSGPNPQVLLDGRGSWKETSFNIEIYQVAAVGSSAQIGNTYQNTTYSGTVDKIDLSQTYNFQSGKVYQVRLITHNSCGSSSSVGWITILPVSQCGGSSNGGGNTSGGRIAMLPSVYEDINTIERKTEQVSLSINEALKLSPNPAKEYVQVHFNIEENESYELSLWNSLGTKLRTIQTAENGSEFNQSINIDLTNLSSGSYYVVLQTSNKRITKNLIVVK
jgi:hypothetical protein